MKKTLLVIAILTAFTSTNVIGQKNSGQSYQTALGIKVWDGAGITLKHFISPTVALEGIGYFWNRGARITGLYEIHGAISGAPGLKWYVGPGAHIGIYNTKYGGKSFGGVDGVLGLDYKFNGAPINMSIDWQPSFEFGDDRGFVGSWGGFAVRYTF